MEMKNTYKPILCLDFDGVLNSYETGWSGIAVVKDEPTKGAVEFVNKAIEHFTVAVFSTRSTSQEGIDAMKVWMKKHGFPVDKLSYPTTKPPAFVTIDDRAITFTGHWPGIDELVNFKPWNK